MRKISEESTKPRLSSFPTTSMAEVVHARVGPNDRFHSCPVSDLWSISRACLRTAFTHADPKSTTKQSSCQCLFALLGSACTKVAYKTLVKLTPRFREFEMLDDEVEVDN